MPSDYGFGWWGSFLELPVFEGGQTTNDYWFYFYQGNGGPSNLHFYYLKVRGYRIGGVALDGPSKTNWNGSNYFRGNYFHELGSLYKANGPTPGYAGIALVRSRNNLLQSNHFVDLENPAGSEQAYIHGVYMRDEANWNRIENNAFINISGDPIRVRNYSNGNTVQYNSFTNTGRVGLYGDWYNNPSGGCGTATHTTGHQECPSWQNWFRGNTMNCGYDGAPIPIFDFTDDASPATGYNDRYCAPSPGCQDHTTNAWDRIYTASNAQLCP